MTDRVVRVVLRGDASSLQRALLGAGAGAQGLAERLEAADGRMSALIQSGLALAPAIVPIGAAAVPAIAGLTLQLGLAGAAAGVTALAFHGVGDGIKALDAYQLDPTAANFEKLTQAMHQLGPAGQEFVLTIDKMEPEVRRLQALAQQGLLPGVTDGLEDLLRLAPQAQQVIFSISSTLGDLAAQGGKELAGSAELRDFITYVNSTARPVLTEMAQSAADVVAGVGDLVMAADPLSRDFSTGVRQAAADFREWADGLAATQGYQDFLSYVEKSGPAALDALGSIGNALVQLVKAAAPVGSAVLPVIADLADGLAAVADSPVGPLLISTAAAVGTLGRSLAILKAVGLRGGGDSIFARTLNTKSLTGLPATLREASAATTAFAAAEREAGLAHARYIGSLKAESTMSALIPGRQAGKGVKAAAQELVAANNAQAASAARVREAESAKASAIRAGAVTIGKSAAIVAGLAVATSDYAQKSGLANTATFALLGTLAGPWGAVIGGGIGLVKDFASANNDLESTLAAVNRAASNPAGLTDFASQIGAAQSVLDSMQSKVNASTNPFTALIHPLQFLQAAQIEWTGGLGDARDRLSDFRKEAMANSQALGELYATLNHGDMSMIGAPLEQLQGFAQQITPALQAAGMSFDDLAKHPQAAAAAIRAYDAEMDTAGGKSRSVGAALADLGSEMTDTATAADQLKSSMDSLFGIQLSQSAATDAWIQSLHSLNSALKGTHDTLVGGSKAALENRAAIRDSVSALEDKINADAAAGVSGDKLVGTLLRGRDAITRQAVAAGASRKQVEAYLDTLGLTPKNLTTIITADGALSAKKQVDALRAVYRLTPKELRTLVSEAGAKPTEAKIDALAKKYKLTPKEVRTLLSATDKASPVARKAQVNARNFAKGGYSAKLFAVDRASGTTAKAKTNATNFAKGGYSAKLFAVDRASAVSGKAKGNATDFANGPYRATLSAQDNASGVAARVRSAYNSIPRLISTQIITTRIDKHIRLDQSLDQNRAGGGLIRGPGTSTSDSIPAYLSDREYVVRAAAVDKYGVALFDRLNAMTFSTGGPVQRLSGGGPVHLAAGGQARGDAAEHKRQVKAIREVTHELQKLRDQIKATRQTRHQYAQQVSQAFVQDPFGGTLGGFTGQVAYETRRLRETRTDLSTLRKQGLGAGLYKALAASGNATLIDQFAHLSKQQLAAQSTAFRVRNSLDRQVGEQAANRVYGERLRDLSGEVKHLTREIHALRHGRHIGNTNFNGRVTIQDGGKTKTKAAAARRRQP